ncbi:MAG: hypothetical protein FWF47_03390 [Clostridia bacterium]|nr:hypothetical protein [Clostridia bacterium]
MRSTFIPKVLCLALALCLCAGFPVLAQESVYSAVLSIEDVATLAKVHAGVDDDVDIPEGAVLVAALFQPQDAAAPDSLTVIAVGAGMPEKVYLTKENGYRVLAEFTPSIVPLRYMLAELKTYTVQVSSDKVVFYVDLSGMADEITPDQPRFYDIHISPNYAPGEMLYYGQVIQYTAQLSGFEDTVYTLQWQQDTGSGWGNIPGETQESYSFILDSDNYNWWFRLVAVITE